MKNTMNENIEDLVWRYISATRSIQPNNLTALRILGSLLYLGKTGHLRKATNVCTDDPSVFIYMDKSYIDTMAGTMSRNWEEKGIQNMAICTSLPKNDALWKIVSTCIYGLLKVSEPIDLFVVTDILMNKDICTKDYLAILDFAIKHFMAIGGRTFGVFTQPIEMAQLVAKLIDSSCDTIFNPFAGALSYATEIAHYKNFEAVEIDSDIWAIGMLRAALSERINRISSTLGDVANWPSKKYDAIVSTPPFRMKMDMAGFIFVHTELSDTVALRRFETSTTEKGELFTYVPLSVLVSDNEEALRQELTEKGYVDTIIILPSGIMPSTNIPTALLILRKTHTVERPIRMVNASSLFSEIKNKRILDVDAILEAIDDSSKSSLVSVAEIKDNQWSWDVNAYRESMERQRPDGYVMRKFGQIVDSPVVDRHFEDIKGHIVKISDLSDSPYDYRKSPWDFPIVDDLSNTIKCCEPVLLLSTVRTIKPTFCEASKENPIFVSKNIAPYRVSDPNIDLGYLCCELTDALPIVKGAFIQGFTRSSLLRLKLFFPSTIEEQKQIFQARRKEAKLGQAKELGLQEIIDSMKAEYINIVRTRKHDMRPYIRELGSVERIMRHYVSKREEMEDFSEKMTSLLDQYHIALDKLSNLIDIFSEEDNFGTPEAFNVDKFLYDLEINHDEEVSGYVIEYDCDDDALREYGLPIHEVEKRIQSYLNGMISREDLFKFDLPKDDVVPLIIDIAPMDFERMVLNIIENARTHGFTDSQRNDYRIDINLTINTERDMYQIDFSNNGNPLPKGMNKIRYGLLGEKAGITGGSGRGGYVVKSIVEHYHGDYDVFMNGETTVIRILLPISKQYGE